MAAGAAEQATVPAASKTLRTLTTPRAMDLPGEPIRDAAGLIARADAKLLRNVLSSLRTQVVSPATIFP